MDLSRKQAQDHVQDKQMTLVTEEWRHIENGTGQNVSET